MSLLSFEHDDTEGKSSRSKRTISILSVIVLVASGSFFLKTTLAANININTGLSVEFGQGVAAATSCSGSNSLLVTPNGSFTNSSGSSGTFYFKSVTVSGIPASCNGYDFQISAFDSTTGTAALSLFNTSKSVATIYDNAGSFVSGISSTGSSVTSGSGAFTVTFTTPVALAGSIFKLTLQSLIHTPIPCTDGGDCVVGETGPGGGNIFLVSAGGFNCGATFSSTGSPSGGLCHYLEAAPKTWAGGTTDVQKSWLNDANTATDVAGITDDSTYDITSAGIGLGYRNSLALVAVLSSTTTGAAATRAYNGGSKSDWYLPSTSELNQMLRWSRGQATSVYAVLPNYTGTLNTPPAQGFIEDQYWSSSEYNASLAWSQHDGSNTPDPRNKDTSHVYLVRPIRAF